MPVLFKKETEKIACPNCDAVQLAEVVLYEGSPFWAYVHHCETCRYIILESEWEKVDDYDIQYQCTHTTGGLRSDCAAFVDAG